MKIRKSILLLLAMFILIALCAGTAWAEGGDGSGGGSDKPLLLDYSSLPDGSTDVATDVSITLTFTKNVVNMAVRDNNSGCFSLTAADGSSVPVSVIMGDDQVDPDVKRIITVEAYGLSPATTYTLTVSGALTSKSGVSLGNPVYLSFTTKAAEPQPAPAPAPQPAAEPQPAPADTVAVSEQPASEPPEKDAEAEKEKEDAEAASETEKEESDAKQQEEKPAGALIAADESADAAEDQPDAGGSGFPAWVLIPIIAVVAAAVIIIARKRK